MKIKVTNTNTQTVELPDEMDLDAVAEFFENPALVENGHEDEDEDDGYDEDDDGDDDEDEDEEG